MDFALDDNGLALAAITAQKFDKIARQAEVKTGSRASELLQGLARKAGLVVEDGGKHYIVKTQAGQFVTTIPRTITNRPLAQGIVKALRQVAKFK